MAKHSPHVLELAKRGAEAQLRDLVQELRYLLELFPHLQDSFDADELPLRFIMAKDAGRLTAKSAAAPGSRPQPSPRKAVRRRAKKSGPVRRSQKKG